MAGGVEDQQLRPLLLGESEGVQTLDQLLCRRQIGPHQVGAQVFGLDAEVDQGAGGLHQGAAQQGTARPIHGQGQLRCRGFGVELPRAVHNQSTGAPFQQLGLPAQPGEHPVVLQILPRLVQGQGKQKPLPLELREVLGPADQPNLPAGQSLVQYPVQAGLFLLLGERGIDHS